MSPDQVARSLALHKYRWSSTAFTSAEWYIVYLSPDDGHVVSVRYLVDRQTCKLHLSDIEVK